jgi:AcrR family transcriptional regulator
VVWNWVLQPVIFSKLRGVAGVILANLSYYRGVPKVSEEYRLERRQQIMEASLRCFFRKGFSSTSMADIIEETGLSAGAIYGHFTGKNDLIVASISLVIERRLEGIHRLVREGDFTHPSAIVRQIVLGFESEQNGLDGFLHIWSQCALDKELRELSRGFEYSLTEMILVYIVAWLEDGGVESHVAQEQAARLVAVFVGITQGYIVQQSFLPNFNVDEYFAAIDYLIPSNIDRFIQGD